MKKLILMRHSKSDWDNNLDDFDRPLSDRGKKEAPIIGEVIKTENIIPDLIISSPSQRTKETLDLLLKKIKKDIKVKYDDKIYENIPSKIIDIISTVDKNIDTLMILGHNPSMENLSEHFTESKYLIDKFVTSGLALIEFDIKSWDEVKNNKGNLIFFKTPK